MKINADCLVCENTGIVYEYIEEIETYGPTHCKWCDKGEEIKNNAEAEAADIQERSYEK